MTMENRKLQGGLLSYFGIGRSDQPSHAAPRRIASTSLEQARRDVMERISDFLIENGLEISVENLVIVHGIVSGLNPGLCRRIKRRSDEGLQITGEWLKREAASQASTTDRSIDVLADRLQQGINDFSRTSEDARNVTRSYGDALESHVGMLEAQPDAGEVIADLAQYARAMLARSRKAEADLEHAEREAEALRRDLARARQDSQIDFLTGLPNRRAFEKRLEEEYAAARLANEPLCVGFCDIDRFKAVNDRHGHEAGDRILCVVGKTLSAISGDRCHVARHGGEEFVVLFCGVTLNDAHDLLDSVRVDLSQRKLVNRSTEEPFGQITFSAGLADVFAYPNPRDALAAADEALYLAKEEGRNRICMASECV